METLSLQFPLRLACEEVLIELRAGRVSSRQQLHRAKQAAAHRFGLPGMPSTADIVGVASPAERERFRHLLTRKPSRTLSGIASIAVMVPPHDCPAPCTYCPSGLGVKTPKSYTGREPSTLRAIRANYDPRKIVEGRIRQYREVNKSPEKIELIQQGGTFFSTPEPVQRDWVIGCLQGVTQSNETDLGKLKSLAEKSRHRVVGFTFETRPDWCSPEIIDRMLSFGGTRVELGVQTLDETIYKKTARGQTVEDVRTAFAHLKDSAFKICAHWMPGQPGSTREGDLADFRKLFDDGDFRPDMLKLYPCLVVKGTALHRQWEQGNFTPLSTEEAAAAIAEMKRFIPKYVRVMRIQRDIPADVIVGVTKSNLREFVESACRARGISCKCIRCREAGLKAYKSAVKPSAENAELCLEEYSASHGKEFFLSFEDASTDCLFGFVRLRFPHKPFRSEITQDTALIRELHVYSDALALGAKPAAVDYQHRGFGVRLMGAAEETARAAGYKKLLVIAGLGVKEYYRRLGYQDDGPFVSKPL